MFPQRDYLWAPQFGAVEQRQKASRGLFVWTQEVWLQLSLLVPDRMVSDSMFHRSNPSNHSPSTPVNHRGSEAGGSLMHCLCGDFLVVFHKFFLQTHTQQAVTLLSFSSHVKTQLDSPIVSVTPHYLSFFWFLFFSWSSLILLFLLLASLGPNTTTKRKENKGKMFNFYLLINHGPTGDLAPWIFGWR